MVTMYRPFEHLGMGGQSPSFCHTFSNNNQHSRRDTLGNCNQVWVKRDTAW